MGIINECLERYSGLFVVACLCFGAYTYGRIEGRFESLDNEARQSNFDSVPPECNCQCDEHVGKLLKMLADRLERRRDAGQEPVGMEAVE